jgi:hypothetical protein
VRIATVDLLVLAQEHFERDLWYPTILGVLVVVFAIALFCGSIYLLLGTNLGARLGFLVAFTGLMGFMTLLTGLWITTASPLNTLKGRVPSWKVKQVVENLDDAKIEAARTIRDEGKKADTTQAADVKAFVDENLVKPEETATEPAEPSKFARFEEVTDYLTLDTFLVGGGSPNPFSWELRHEPQVAAVEYCPVLDVEVPFGLPPPEPECDPDQEAGFVVLERDLGSLRVPPFVALAMFGTLFALGLLNLHWREKDEAEAAARVRRPVPVPSET